MLVNKIEYVDLEKAILETGKSYLEYLTPELGKAYVISITRDGCPACEKQKPEIQNLASTIKKKYGEKVIFTQIHVKQVSGSQIESLRSKDVLKHYFYPTNLISLRTVDRGALEVYRNVSPSMEELGKNIELAVKMTEMFLKMANE